MLQPSLWASASAYPHLQAGCQHGMAGLACCTGTSTFSVPSGTLPLPYNSLRQYPTYYSHRPSPPIANLDYYSSFFLNLLCQLLPPQPPFQPTHCLPSHCLPSSSLLHLLRDIYWLAAVATSARKAGILRRRHYNNLCSGQSPHLHLPDGTAIPSPWTTSRPSVNPSHHTANLNNPQPLPPGPLIHLSGSPELSFSLQQMTCHI